MSNRAAEFMALAQAMDRVKTLPDGPAFIAHLLLAVIEREGLIVVDQAEYRRLLLIAAEGKLLDRALGLN